MPDIWEVQFKLARRNTLVRNHTYRFPSSCREVHQLSASQSNELLLEQVARGDQEAREYLFSRYMRIVRNLVHLRIDHRVAQRISPSDIVQETMIEVSNRLDDFLQKRPMSFDAWVRRTAYQNLARIRRTHLGTARRDVGREVALSIAGSVIIVNRLELENNDDPSVRLERDELVQQVQHVMMVLTDEDRELILMRTCDGLDNATAAAVLDIDPRLCSKRYSRALLKLRNGLRKHDGEMPI